VFPSDPGQESEVVAAWGEAAEVEPAGLTVADADAELEAGAALLATGLAAELDAELDATPAAELDATPAAELDATPAAELEPEPVAEPALEAPPAPAALFKTIPTTAELETPAVRVLFM